MTETKSLEVHRCQFLDWDPSGIRAMAVNDEINLLAVARANADIEIWEISKKFFVHKVIPGHKNVSIRSLVWVREKLFSAGLNGMIIEWNLETLLPERTFEFPGVAIWSISLNPQQSHLVVACDDGVLRLVQVSTPTLTITKFFEKKKGRILSVDWSHDGQYVFGGTSTGEIHKWSVSTGRISLTIEINSVRKSKLIVWAVKALKDGTIISGSSKGQTEFWDGNLGTQISSFNSHGSDILSIAVSKKGDLAFSAGIDHKIVVFQLVPQEIEEPANKKRKTAKESEVSLQIYMYRWFMTQNRRPHTHDIHTLAISNRLGLLFSGGNDTQLSVLNIYHIDSSPQKVFPFPTIKRFIGLAAGKKLLMCQYSNKIDIWKLGTSNLEDKRISSEQFESDKTLLVQHPHLQILSFIPSEGYNIICSAISFNGDYFSFSDTIRPRIISFELTQTEQLRTKLLETPFLTTPAHVMCFSANSRLFLADCYCRVFVVNINKTSGCSLLKVFDPISEGGQKKKSETYSIKLIAASVDGQWGATVDSNERIVLYNLDTLQIHRELPILNSPVSTINFNSNGQFLAIGCVSCHILLYDTDLNILKELENFKFYGYNQKEWKCVDTFKGCSFNSSGDLLLFHTQQKIYVFELAVLKAIIRKDRSVTAKSIDESSVFEPITESVKVKCTIIPKYSPMLFASFLNDSLVVVERPWLQVMENLPKPLYRKRYAAPA
eukprot:c14520_g1_i2.p1 GENE.c14520_g1_i2~~c14520_g1_i2.p1  ORF type:complete len:719 (+),score=248.36 c14520_g1_i2:40-2196(+)